MEYPKFVKYMRIPHLAEIPEILDYPVEVFEKLDGGNVQVRKHKGIILAGNRSKFLIDKDTRFDWFQNFLKWAKGNYSFYNLPENLIIFGEWLSHHTLSYPKKAENKFYVIDVFDTNEKKFLNYNEGEKLLDNFEIKDSRFLNPFLEGKVNKKILEKIVQHSDYREGESEGIVIKHYPSQSFAKLWASSIRKHAQIHYLDLKRTYMSMIESGEDISIKSITKKLYDDLRKSGLMVSQHKVQDYIFQHYNSLDSFNNLDEHHRQI